MAKAKAKSKKATRKPTELNKANLAKIAAVAKTEMAAAKKGDKSMCEGIRTLAKRLRSVRRVEIEAVLTGAPFKVALGTVRRQIQLGRSE